ncbi:SWIM zinc finger family protein [Streptomyces mayonensis]|uniref:SWIM zinc finger family protein n=1 Tax=Streptomyces mayonensis TaxID=2750816 RepID=UPI001C1E5596|nr:SWIM zinc finger family protein [Streptomyces sp. A108]MBU6532679.1 SWIM zinc finger family protein [Streptomyces sp. A108]
MTQQGARWTVDQVLALAPDAASRQAAGRLGAAGPWSGVGSSGVEDSDGWTAWGLCRDGSGSEPYRTVVTVGDGSGPVYRCDCQGRGLPCEHALGLLLLWTGGDGAVPEGDAPAWARRWLAEVQEGSARRRKERRERRERQEPTAGPHHAVGPGATEAAWRRAEERAGRITAGVTDLEQRLTDLLRGGLAGAEQPGYALWEETAARMVDAQAPGLASRVRELGTIPASGPGWPVRLLEECALLHLLGRGWLHRERLPDGLAATVRSRVGLPTSADGPPVRDRWLVVARYDTADARLTTRRTWLYGVEEDRTVLLLSYGASGRPLEPPLPVGLALDAEVSAHPDTGRRRVALGRRFGPPAPTPVRPGGVTASRAAGVYGEALREDPWLESVPVTLERVVPVPDGDAWQLADADSDTALPLTPAAGNRPGLWRLVALSGGAPVTVFGECGHRGFTPLTAWPTGPGRAVPLC